MKKFHFTVLLLALLAACTRSSPDYYVCAYVWPSCHDDSLAHAWIWPQGKGEWEVIQQGAPRFPAKGAEHVTRFHNTPAVFGSYLETAKAYADAHPDQPRFVMINAWNEWVEGSYLLPDRLNGYGYLEQVKRVFTSDGTGPGR